MQTQLEIDASATLGRSAAAIHPLARSVDEWAEVLSEMGEKPFRAKQIFRWLHERGVFEPEEMTDLSKDLRTRLRAAGVTAPGSVTHVHESADGTRKLLVKFSRGAEIECVIIPMTPDVQDADATVTDEDEEDEPEQGGPKKRITLCISTQFGCAMGCTFCASGQSGLFRGLGAAEVVFQVLIARRYLRPDEEIRNLVYMGMGEPLHHIDETERSLRLISDPAGRGMSLRRVTVSTVGLVPGIRRLGETFSGKVGLAISLHATDNETRSRIMPMNKKYPIEELMQALRAYPLPPRRRMTIEYTLMGGVNDSLKQADELAELLRPLKVKVNLIPMNPIEASDLKAPDPAQVALFRERLASHGYSVFVRTRRGDDVSAACGQLALKAISPERLVRRGPIKSEGD